MKLAQQFLFILVLLGSSLGAYATAPEVPEETDCAKLMLPGQEVEAAFQASFQEQIDKDFQFLQKLQESAVPEYLALRTAALESIRRGEKDFSFAPHRAVVERIAGDAKQRQTRKFGKKYQERLEAVHQKALHLLSQGDPPYKATIKFVMFEYLPLLDDILGERHPELMQNEYHRHHAEHLVEKFLAGAPDFFMFFSFEYTNDMFFVDTRPALMNLVGISLQGLDDDLDSKPFGDQFYMKISEFAWHDWGHAEFTSFRDLAYILTGGKPIERVVWEWEVTRQRIKEVVDQTKARDFDLGEAMEQIEFEFLRERGFQFSLTVFKQELETPKWTETLQRKLKSGFYNHGGGTNLKKFERLEEARKALLTAVERYKEESQLEWIKAANGQARVNGRLIQVPVRITYTPALGYSNTAKLDYIEILGVKKVMVHSKNEPAVVEVGELISAQVAKTKNSPFSEKGVVRKIEELLWIRNNDTKVFAYGEEKSIRSIIVTTDRKILVLMNSGESIPLSEVSHKKTLLMEIPKMPNLEVFKMEQVLGTEERGETMAFSIRPPTQVFVGQIRTEQDLVSGHYTAHIQTQDGKKLELPLMQIRVDPLHDSSKEQ